MKFSRCLKILFVFSIILSLSQSAYCKSFKKLGRYKNVEIDKISYRGIHIIHDSGLATLTGDGFSSEEKKLLEKELKKYQELKEQYAIKQELDEIKSQAEIKEHTQAVSDALEKTSQIESLVEALYILRSVERQCPKATNINQLRTQIGKLEGEKAHRDRAQSEQNRKELFAKVGTTQRDDSLSRSFSSRSSRLKLMPPESVIRASAITDKALFYMKSLKGKLLALEEAAGVKDTYAIRTLISEGYLTQETVSGGHGQTLHVEGGCSIFQTTTNPEINPETKSRFFVLGVDESREQTRRILELQRKAHTLAGLKTNSEIDGIIGKHQTFQRLLEPYAIVNPYADELFYEDDRLQARRDQPKFLQLINTIAFLNQMKKKIKRYEGIEYIEVDRTDINMAAKLASELLGISLDDLSLPARDLLHQLQAMNRKIFTRSEAMAYTGWTKTRLHTHLTELMDMELVIKLTGKQNCLQTYKLLYNGEGQDGRKFCIGFNPVQ